MTNQNQKARIDRWRNKILEAKSFSDIDALRQVESWAFGAHAALYDLELPENKDYLALSVYAEKLIEEIIYGKAKKLCKCSLNQSASF